MRTPEPGKIAFLGGKTHLQQRVGYARKQIFPVVWQTYNKVSSAATAQES